MTPDEDSSNVIPFPSRGRDQPAVRGLENEESDEGRSRRRVTLLLAELRGWADVSEQLGSEQAGVSMSRAVDRALSTLGEKQGHDIVLEGDATQPAFSCTFEGPGGPLHALRAAIAVRRAIAEVQSPAPPERQFRIGIGIDSGDVEDVSGDDAPSYQAVGSIRMFATRLRDFAGTGQIFLSAEVYEGVEGLAQVQALGEVRVNAYGDARAAFSLTDLRARPEG